MKRTLKRELKGLEVVKMETNGFSTDRGANQGVMVTTWAAFFLARALWSLAARFRRCYLVGTLRCFLRSVSMSARSGRKAVQVR